MLLLLCLLRFLAWVFALARGFCALRGVLTLMIANWPLMLVNCFWACFARYGRQCFVGMVRNGR